jgi:hypothetical protein
MGAMVVIFGAIIGTIVVRNKTLDTSDPATTAPTVSGNTTNVTLGCDTMMKEFESESLVVTMSVMSGISAVEIEYAANVFEETYGAMLANELSQAQADYCDPYCRKITNVVVSANALTTSAAATAEARQSSGACDASLELTFSVEGTWYGCEETVWPGLFAPDGRRALQKNLRRILEEVAEDSCPVCPDDATSLGLVSPSTTQLKEVMAEFVAVLPAICELTDAKLLAPSA